MTRSTWHTCVGAVGAGWLVALTVVSVRALTVGVDPWLPIHLLLLGAASTAILIWSTYFTEALLRLGGPRSHTSEAARLGAFDIGAITVVWGMTADRWILVAVGAGLAVLSATWHTVVLLQRIRRSLPSRFGATVRYYVGAGALLPLGIGLGVIMAPDTLTETMHARVALAHVTLNVLGWMGLTVVGTLITLWPTMLHARIPDGAERIGRRALPILLLSLLVAAGSALAGSRALTVIGLLGYAVGLLLAGRPLLQEARQQSPHTYATWSVGSGALWLVGTVVALALVIATAPGWTEAAATADRLAAPLLVGFAAQTLLGALSYLVPVVLGGGPSVARATHAALDTGARTRVVIINLGVLAAASTATEAHRWLLLLPLGALAAFLPLVGVAVLARHRSPATPR
jgi:nitrite reductase (NO-forming)